MGHKKISPKGLALGADADIITSATTLGVDTEMILTSNGEQLFPHNFGLPIKSPYRLKGGGYGYVFHGDGYAFEACINPGTCCEILTNSVADAGVGLELGVTYSSGMYGLEKVPGIEPVYTLPWVQRSLSSPQNHDNDPSLTLHLSALRTEWMEKNKRNNMVASAPVLYTVPSDVAKSAPKSVTQLGCAPSFNVYGDPGIPTSLGSRTRTTGFHMHYTLNSQVVNALKYRQDRSVVEAQVAWMDILAGSLWTYLNMSNPEHEVKRRSAYGRAGEFRLINPGGAPGIEYRVLPGTVGIIPTLPNLLLRAGRLGFLLGVSGHTPTARLVKEARAAINEWNVEAAQRVMEEVYSDSTLETIAAYKLALMDTWKPECSSGENVLRASSRYAGTMPSGPITFLHGRGARENARLRTSIIRYAGLNAGGSKNGLAKLLAPIDVYDEFDDYIDNSAEELIEAPCDCRDCLLEREVL